MCQPETGTLEAKTLAACARVRATFDNGASARFLVGLARQLASRQAWRASGRSALLIAAAVTRCRATRESCPARRLTALVTTLAVYGVAAILINSAGHSDALRHPVTLFG